MKSFVGLTPNERRILLNHVGRTLTNQFKYKLLIHFLGTLIKPKTYNSLPLIALLDTTSTDEAECYGL